MQTIEKVIAILNDFDMADKVLEKALTLSSQQKAVLEVLYVHEEPLFDVPDYFRREHSGEDGLIDKGKIKKEIENRIAKFENDCNCAIFVFIDDTVSRFERLTKEDANLFVVTAYHDKITHTLVQKTLFPILVVKNAVQVYEKIVLPVDLTDTSHVCIDIAETLYPHTDKRLLYDYRYVVDTEVMDVDYLGMPTAAPMINMQINEAFKESQLEAFKVLKNETGLKGDFIEESLSVEDDLLAFITSHDFDLTVLCAGEKHFLASDSLSYSLLERLLSDVLIVPN